MLEIALCAALDALADGRVFPDTAPEGVQRPFITFQAVGGQSNVVMAGPGEARNARVQINVWANTRLGAGALMERVRATVCDRTKAGSLNGTPIGEPDWLHEDDTDWYGSRMDFSLWYSLQPNA
ncbi:hypothetical protein F4827_005073 [Paraburkholderia bannensis]|uniref:DUF3168 domain-containing protein n=1 Tax=Paraburkholderia bannensis TaxID=765414 RepID=A0A7W9WVC1_9BURK|nr:MULTISPECIES: DUF3168 domain-containing protein [Paraburkholderia]MBB3260001.1 hypothetical protein [Paraburkholderia sp. WP4_3_2]MBB6105207.1 hypothetical protein [Paraburkholderia bannensis]